MEVRSILENSDMNTQKFVAAPFIIFSSSESSAMGLLWYSCTIFQPKSDESASLVIM
jgi:hypothetical protein